MTTTLVLGIYFGTYVLFYALGTIFFLFSILKTWKDDEGKLDVVPTVAFPALSLIIWSVLSYLTLYMWTDAATVFNQYMVAPILMVLALVSALLLVRSAFLLMGQAAKMIDAAPIEEG